MDTLSMLKLETGISEYRTTRRYIPNIDISSQFIIALLEVLNYALKFDEMVPFRMSSLVLS
jgi:hypothetical protein